MDPQAPKKTHLRRKLCNRYISLGSVDQLAQVCYSHVNDRCFDWETVAGQFDDTFQEVLAKREEEVPRIVKPKAKGKKKKS